ncbi:amidase [Arthrobacter crystallopoietes]|uniref:Aspartyl-tRNA(Asn)/glutamyl-tRNA(Gln) amidotransferase subunit A n=1 Tax=Crystallibacter crystallopoietes TaxID=37928 RepID=A0A1H1AQ33_9MICC|nr:amidase [Arthrobacter crystallopoietes]AUI51441.1 amidase [Arthrobacter crystallopoietes]SDQ41769.1 aspartyl-tRNA(Asn)/glutamyl-tRNA(Gln) amidotransferase subunit A [Arthrobacter crystallopoietes]
MSPLSSTTLHDLSARELGEAYAAKELSPVDVADAVIARIEEREPVLNALYQFEPEAVRKDAKASERRWLEGSQRGPLDGVPVSVKENIARAGVPMPSGTALSNPKVPQNNSPITDRILEAGGVIVGSTTMPDWGMLSSGVSSLHGISRSAWNPAWTTGGSSSGAGSAAAAGYGPLHVGTDIGGSIRLPGAWQGLATLKPSAGLIPLDVPYIGRAAGPMARTVADAALFMTILGQPDIRDYTARPYPPMDWTVGDLDVSSLKVALQTEANAGAAVDPEVLAAVKAVAEHFADAGAHVESLEPFIDQDMLDRLDRFWRTRSWADYRELPAAEQQKVLPYIARWCQGGSQFDGAETIRNFGSIDQMQKATIAATAEYDVVISPVAPMAAFPAEQPMPVDDPDRTMAHIAFTVPYNMSGQPAATVNCGFTSDGRPIGVQLSGRVGADDDVLRAAAWYESARPAVAVPDWGSLD